MWFPRRSPSYSLGDMLIYCFYHTNARRHVSTSNPRQYFYELMLQTGIFHPEIPVQHVIIFINLHQIRINLYGQSWEARQYTVDGNPRMPFQQMVFFHDDTVEFPDLARSVHLPPQQANILRQGNCSCRTMCNLGRFFWNFGGFVEMNCPKIYHKHRKLHMCLCIHVGDGWEEICGSVLQCNRGHSYKILPAKCTWESLGLNSAS